MQKPSIGRIVLMPVDAINLPSNGADVVPAIITRVWNDGLVNVQAFLDGGLGVAKTSVHLYEDEAAAEAGAPSATRAFAELRCYWPPRV